MRQILLCLFCIVLLTASYAQKDCQHQLYQQQLLKNNPQLANAYEKVEAFTNRSSNNMIASVAGINGAGTGNASISKIITIPVVVHVLWNNASQNISNAQILSQIDVLNNDYRGTNADRNKIPDYFAGLAADCGIQFALAKTDPQGNNTTGIIRKQTYIQSFGVDDGVKKSDFGGDDAWDAGSYLNIWVCNMQNGIQGYSSAPGCPKETDGVVINANVFGTLNISGPFNKGRTAVHEIGHWLNLRHIWGDAACGDDKVDDTPTQQAATRGCPGGQKFTCGSTEHGDMYMNYMDFTDDACMFMFTDGQRQRMRVLFEQGGPRNAILSSNALKGDGIPVQTNVPDIEHQPDFNVMLYPNPTSSSFTIQAKEQIDCAGKNLVIYNHLGQIMKTVLLQSGQQQIDVSRLQNGLYFIKIEGIKTKAMAKFIKQ